MILKIAIIDSGRSEKLNLKIEEQFVNNCKKNGIYI